MATIWLTQQSHLKPSSLRVLEIAWRLQVEPRRGTTAVSDVRYNDVRVWGTEMSERRSATVVIRAYSALAAILDVAVRDRRMLSNPARGGTTPRKGKKAHTYLTHDQVCELAIAAGDLGPLVLVLAHCRLRWGDVKDIDPFRNRLNVQQHPVQVGDRIIVGAPKSQVQRPART